MVLEIGVLFSFSTVMFSLTAAWPAETIYRLDRPNNACAMVALSWHAAISELRRRGRHYGMPMDCDRTKRSFGVAPRRQARFKALLF